MNDFDRKKHWETIYSTKDLKEVSWYQKVPTTSIEFITSLNLPKTAKIIDIGGGDSLLVDHLLNLGYSNITVLDVSETAIHKAKERLGDLADTITWIVTDITDFTPNEKYDVWHDRATFHFLREQKEIDNYVMTIENAILPAGALIIGTFSLDGPKKCSGIDITPYSEKSMSDLVKSSFKKLKCSYINHETPFNTTQNFIFCSFQKQK
ncbi:class I SAM-dependent methyltransferase [Aquimarina muelleri]|uniref:Methyltransferase type 12 domain-containing protein n=1 Tax=Aquimarina muelleri TaxID=279356 RepID=A0A918N3D3_9FLAO|nr:class I SAM-dependent methyltransferase [Aquimarina muelleri]MCX2762756.1 class I SAM-dependent methyltransferase [Aquimarina muelleri]GGX18866.1 hypothetical protein GCM10007384_20260 [Aquimarina muelleri]